MYSRLLSADKWALFIVLCLCKLLLVYLVNGILVTKEMMYQTYGEQIAAERIEQFWTLREKWMWTGYLMVVIILLVEVLFTAFCLNIGALFAGMRTGFGAIFGVSLAAETLFILSSAVNTALLFSMDMQSLLDIKQFAPFSVYALFDPESVESWFTYPLQTINLFEAAYWFALIKGLQVITHRPFMEMFGLVACTYGVGLLVWMATVVFLSISLG